MRYYVFISGGEFIKVPSAESMLENASVKTRLDSYLELRNNNADSWGESYKWRLFPIIQAAFQIAIDPAAKIDVLIKKKPKQNNFLWLSGLATLRRFGKDQPVEAQKYLETLFDEGKDISERIDYLRGKYSLPNQGTPIFGYILAIHDYSKYPLYRDSIFQNVRKDLLISGEKRNSTPGEKYQIFQELCLSFGAYMNEKKLLKPEFVDGIEIVPGFTALDGQDFLYCQYR